MAKSLINSEHYFSAIVLILWITCISNDVDGAPISTLTPSCKDKQQPCRHYKALLTHAFDKAVTFHGYRVALKNVTHQPLSVYELMYSKTISTSMADQTRPNWKTIGGKYLAVNSNGHLTLEDKNSTRFLANFTFVGNYETFYLCAIKGSRSYLVPSRKTRAKGIECSATACENEHSFQKQLTDMDMKKFEPYKFVGVSITDTDFEAVNIPLSDELKNLCKL